MIQLLGQLTKEIVAAWQFSELEFDMEGAESWSDSAGISQRRLLREGAEGDDGAEG